MIERENMDPITEMIEHMQRFVEKPNAAFGKFPICPFAHKARKDDRIQWIVEPFVDADLQDGSRMLTIIDEFKRGNKYDCIVFLHPDKAFTQEQTVEFTKKLSEKTASMGVVIFSGHPSDPFSIGNQKVRAEPYPNIQVIKKAFFDKAHSVLKKTHYFDKMTPAEKLALES